MELGTQKIEIYDYQNGICFAKVQSSFSRTDFGVNIKNPYVSTLPKVLVLH